MSDVSTEDVVVRFNPPQEGAQELGRRLLAAARDGDTAAVLDLMARGAPFTTDWLGTSPLHLAAANNRADVCGVLLRAGASRDCRTKVDRTPLHLAAYWGHADVCSLLLARGAAVDAQDMLRMTPLHWAAERGHAAACGALLRRGADPLARSKFRSTPRQLAAAAARPDILALMDAPRPDADPDADADTDDVHNETVQATEYVTMEELEGGKMPFEKDREPTDESTDASGAETAGAAESDAGAADSGARAAECGAGAAECGAAESGAARLLRRHGITLLPADPPGSSTALRALRAGRTILLSDAGKLMLKESEAEAGAAPTPAVPAAPAAGAAGGAGLVLRATPVAAPPRGVTVFTLGNKTTEAKLPGKKVQYVSLARTAPRAAPRTAPRALKILMNKHKLHQLLAAAPTAPTAPTAPAAPAADAEDSGEEAVVRVPEQFLRSADPAYLRAQLLAATAALHRATRRLARAERRLQQYEQ